MIISLPQIQIFLLILARIAGIFIDAPIFSAKNIPVSIKVVLAIWISITLWFVTPIKGPLPPDLTTFAFALVNELLIGFLLGFTCKILFMAVQAAGDVMDLQMGLSIATVISPTTGGVVSVVGNLTFFFAMTIFLIANGHHMILSALNQSFRMLPLAAPINIGNAKLMEQLLYLGREFWLLALQLCAPIVLMIFLSDFTFGIVSRVAPQVNVFMLGFQVKPSLGIFGLLLTLPLFARHVSALIGKMGEEMLKLMVIIKP